MTFPKKEGMTNILTDFRGRIVRHTPYRVVTIYAAMVQRLSLHKLRLLSHVHQYHVGSIPGKVTYFWLHFGQFAFIFLYIRLFRKLELMVRVGDIFLPAQ